MLKCKKFKKNKKKYYFVIDLLKSQGYNRVSLRCFELFMFNKHNMYDKYAIIILHIVLVEH